MVTKSKTPPIPPEPPWKEDLRKAIEKMTDECPPVPAEADPPEWTSAQLLCQDEFLDACVLAGRESLPFRYVRILARMTRKAVCPGESMRYRALLMATFVLAISTLGPLPGEDPK